MTGVEGLSYLPSYGPSKWEIPILGDYVLLHTEIFVPVYIRLSELKPGVDNMSSRNFLETSNQDNRD